MPQFMVSEFSGGHANNIHINEIRRNYILNFIATIVNNNDSTTASEDLDFVLQNAPQVRIRSSVLGVGGGD